MPPDAQSPPPVRSGRFALIIGFGGMFLLLAALGLRTLTALDGVEKERSYGGQRFLDKGRLLDHLRSGMHNESLELRYFLLAPDPSEALATRRNLQELHRQIAESFEAYARMASPEESDTVNGATRAWRQYAGSVSEMLGWNDAERRTRGRNFIWRPPAAAQSPVFGLNDSLATLSTRHLQSESERLLQVFSNFRSQVLWLLAATSAAGLVLAFWAIRHVLQLEAAAACRYNELRKTKAELEGLSAKLLQAQEQERRSIARELHDEVGQSMGALLVDLGRALNFATEGDQKTLLTSARSLAEQVMNEVRNLALLLRPSMLDDIGLAAAIHWQAREVTRRTGLRVQVDADDLPDQLSEEHRTCIYRVVQEALHNASRHARATQAKVQIRMEPGRVAVSICDNGIGFDPSQTRGVGIVGMEERARLLGGSFRIDSELGKGATVTIELPVSSLSAPDGTTASA